MKTIMTSIVAMALCIGMASQTLAQGTSTTAPAKHNGEGHFAKMDTNGDGIWHTNLPYSNSHIIF